MHTPQVLNPQAGQPKEVEREVPERKKLWAVWFQEPSFAGAEPKVLKKTDFLDFIGTAKTRNEPYSNYLRDTPQR